MYCKLGIDPLHLLINSYITQTLFMKKSILLFLTGISFMAASAQIQFGLKAGANFAMLTGSGVTGAKTLVGFHGGGLVAIPLFMDFSLQPEVVYSGQGAKGTDDTGAEFKVTQNYLNVPVLFKWNHSSGFFAETGPQVGILLSAKDKQGSTTIDAKSAYNSTDFCWVFGIGYLINSANIGIDARYNLGLSNISKYSSNGMTVKSSVIQVGLFYLFGEGKQK